MYDPYGQSTHGERERTKIIRNYNYVYYKRVGREHEREREREREIERERERSKLLRKKESQ